MASRGLVSIVSRNGIFLLSGAILFSAATFGFGSWLFFHSFRYNFLSGQLTPFARGHGSLPPRVDHPAGWFTLLPAAGSCIAIGLSPELAGRRVDLALWSRPLVSHHAADPRVISRRAVSGRWRPGGGGGGCCVSHPGTGPH